MKLHRLGALFLACVAATSISVAADTKTGSFDCVKQLDARVVKYTPSDLQTLMLSHCNLQDKDMIAVANFLEKHPKITALNLDNNYDITAKGYSALAKSKNINIFSAAHNYIEEDELTEIVKNKNITGIRLDENEIQDYSALDALPNLQFIMVSESYINDEIAINLAQHLSSKPLAFLVANHNEIGAKGAAALSNLKNLSLLSLDMNNIRSNGAIEIAKNSNAAFISLSSNNIGNKGAAAFANHWKPQKTDFFPVSMLNIGRNNLTDETATAFSTNAIPEQFALGVGHNFLSAEGIRVLEQIKNIEVLEIEANEVDANFNMKQNKTSYKALTSYCNVSKYPACSLLSH